MKKLKPCSACGKMLASNATSCPHCGKRFTSAAGIVLAVLIGLAAGGVLTFSTCQHSQQADDAMELLK